MRQPQLLDSQLRTALALNNHGTVVGRTTLQISPELLTRLVPGVAVELAGYGLDEQGGSGALRYLVEQVVAASHSLVTVAGFGRSGACEGDSGAPLLMRENGSLVVGWLRVKDRPL